MFGTLAGMASGIDGGPTGYGVGLGLMAGGLMQMTAGLGGDLGAGLATASSGGFGLPATLPAAMASTAVIANGAYAVALGAIVMLQASAAKGPPNPYGKAGGPEHQATVGEVAQDIQSRGLTPQQEYKVDTPGGTKGTRYVDVVGVDQNGNVTEMHQVGRQTQGGNPVSREVKALDDIENATGTRPTFHPYN